MLNRFSSTLADVERSLRAIDENCYGNCIQCHRPIAVMRLQSIPWAAYCVRCQEQFEAGGAEGRYRTSMSHRPHSRDRPILS